MKRAFFASSVAIVSLPANSRFDFVRDLPFGHSYGLFLVADCRFPACDLGVFRGKLGFKFPSSGLDQRSGERLIELDFFVAAGGR